MKCYLDSSIVLRILFGEKHPLSKWAAITSGFSSRLLRLECLRSIERARLTGKLAPAEMVVAVVSVTEILRGIGTLPLTEHILQRAEQPFATVVGSLDAIHLASALAWQELHGDDFFFATHDQQLALAARAHGLRVIGA